VVIPAGVPESFDEHVKLHFDLQRLAFQADITRVSTVLYARDLTSRSYPESGVFDGFHGISHHAENPETIARYAKLNQYHIKCLAYFVEKMKNTPDGDGTLLDHSLILYGTNMGDSNQHLHYDVPHLLIGGASGQLKGNRHLAYPSKTVPTGNLLASVLDMYGVHEDQHRRQHRPAAGFGLIGPMKSRTDFIRFVQGRFLFSRALSPRVTARSPTRP
jgi:hypothetical protein